MIKKVDLLHAISENIKSDLFRLGVKSNKIIEIPNTVYIKKFNSIRSNKNLNYINLLTVARFAEKKGFDFIELLAKQLKKRLVLDGQLSEEIVIKYTIINL